MSLSFLFTYHLCNIINKRRDSCGGETSVKKKMKSLKLVLKETLLEKVFRDPLRPRKQNSLSFNVRNKKPLNGSPPDSPFAWAVLVLDASTLKILQSCFQTHELTAENIACIEMLHNYKRAPIPLHAIYFLSVVTILNILVNERIY